MTDTKEGPFVARLARATCSISTRVLLSQTGAGSISAYDDRRHVAGAIPERSLGHLLSRSWQLHAAPGPMELAGPLLKVAQPDVRAAPGRHHWMLTGQPLQVACSTVLLPRCCLMMQQDASCVAGSGAHGWGPEGLPSQGSGQAGEQAQLDPLKHPIGM